MVGARQSFKFSREITCFLGNNELCVNLSNGFCIKKSVRESQLYINHASYLKYFQTLSWPVSLNLDRSLGNLCISISSWSSTLASELASTFKSKFCLLHITIGDAWSLKLFLFTLVKDAIFNSLQLSSKRNGKDIS